MTRRPPPPVGGFLGGIPSVELVITILNTEHSIIYIYHGLPVVPEAVRYTSLVILAVQSMMYKL